MGHGRGREAGVSEGVKRATGARGRFCGRWEPLHSDEGKHREHERDLFLSLAVQCGASPTLTSVSGRLTGLIA